MWQGQARATGDGQGRQKRAREKDKGKRRGQWATSEGDRKKCQRGQRATGKDNRRGKGFEKVRKMRIKIIMIIIKIIKKYQSDMNCCLFL